MHCGDSRSKKGQKRDEEDGLTMMPTSSGWDLLQWEGCWKWIRNGVAVLHVNLDGNVDDNGDDDDDRL